MGQRADRERRAEGERLGASPQAIRTHRDAMLDAQTVLREGAFDEVRCTRDGARDPRLRLDLFLSSLPPALDLAFPPDHGTAGAEPFLVLIERLEAGPLGGRPAAEGEPAVLALAPGG